MDHSEAIQGSYAEKYLLGELNPVQRDLFEDHYFDCLICADDVHAGAVFIDNARALLRSEETAVTARIPSPLAGFGTAFRAASLASVCLLGIVAYQNIVVIPGLRSSSGGSRAPEIPAKISTLSMGSRTESKSTVIPAAKDVEFEFEIPGGPEFTGYAFKILDSKKSVTFTLPVSSEQAKDSVPLRIPAGSLAPGIYEIEILGNKVGQVEQELSRYRVAVE